MMFVQPVMTGPVVSTTVTVWVQVLTLLQQSMACQMPFQTFVHKVTFVLLVLTNWIETLVPQQLSVADGGSKLHTVPHSTVLLLVQLSTGGAVSTVQVMSCVQVLLLPQLSTAV